MRIWDTLPDLAIVATICGKDIDRDLQTLLGKSIVVDESTAAEAFIAAGLCESKAEVRRLLRQGATLRISGVVVTDERTPLGDFPSDKGRWVVQRGPYRCRCIKVGPTVASVVS